jgi:hypothetical protein
MKKLLKLTPIFLLAFAGLLAGCSDNGTTSVDPTDLDSLTNNFTSGKGEVSNEVVDGLLKASPYMGYVSNFTSSRTAAFKGNVNAFATSLKGLEYINNPVAAKFMDMLLNYMMLGKPFDPTGTVQKVMGTSKAFRGVNPRVTGDQMQYPIPYLGEQPACFYIDGLTPTLEGWLTTELTEAPTQTQIQQLVNEIIDLLKDFNITIGWTDVCTTDTTEDDEPPIVEGSDEYAKTTMKGSINFKGKFDTSETNIKANLVITVDGFEMVSVYQNDDGGIYTETTTATASGKLEFNTETKVEDIFNFDFTFKATEFDVLYAFATTEAGELPMNVHFAMDGGLAINLNAPAIATAEVIPVNELPIPADAIPAKIPNPEAMTLLFVIDMTMTITMDQGTPETSVGGTLEILWGMKLTTSSGGIGYVIFVYFFDKDHFYLVEFVDPDTDDLKFRVTGTYTDDAKEVINIILNYASEACTVEKVEILPDREAPVCPEWNDEWLGIFGGI